jgi:hypothetical protein
MQEDMFRTFQESYQKGVFNVPTTFYFSIDGIRKTLTLDAESCLIEDGKTIDRCRLRLQNHRSDVWQNLERRLPTGNHGFHEWCHQIKRSAAPAAAVGRLWQVAGISATEPYVIVSCQAHVLNV